MQIVQELCRRPGLNKCGFEMPTIYIPNPQKVCNSFIDSLTRCKLPTGGQVAPLIGPTAALNVSEAAALRRKILSLKMLSHLQGLKKKVQGCQAPKKKPNKRELS